MWNEIINDESLKSFMTSINYFHDSCIKELMYVSGAYVDNNLCMHPLNDKRLLRVILQQQSNEHPMIELEFSGLKYLKLFPVDEQYTCEILGSSMLLKDNLIYWGDGSELNQLDAENSGTTICAAKLRWRFIKGCMGKELYFNLPT